MTLFRTVLRLTAILASVIFFGATAGFAEDLGPAIGTKAPDIGIRLDQSGKPRQLSDLMGRNGLVLFFYRSADWCPFCQAQLVDINSGMPEIEKRGYRVAGLSYDNPEILQATTVKRNLSYTLLSDPKSEIIDRYNLRDPQYPPGNRGYGSQGRLSLFSIRKVSSRRSCSRITSSTVRVSPPSSLSWMNSAEKAE